MGNQKYWAASTWFCMKLVMFAFNENAWQEVLTELMPEVLWDLLTSDVLVQMLVQIWLLFAASSY